MEGEQDLANQLLVRVRRENLKKAERDQALSAFERLGATGMRVDQQITESDEQSLWVVSGEFAGDMVPALTRF